MSLSPSLLPVVSDRIPEFWPIVMDRIASVSHKTGDDTPLDELYEDLLADRRQLWLVANESNVKAVVMTMIIEDHGRRKGYLTHAAGVESKSWARLVIREITGYFTCEKCVKFVIVGRKGWLKFLPDFDSNMLYMQKAL